MPITSAIRPERRTSTTASGSAGRHDPTGETRSASATASSPTARDPLTSTQSPGRRSPRSSATAASTSSTARTSPMLRGAGEIASRERPDRDEHLDAGARGRLADLAVERGGLGAELGHAAEHGDEPAARPPLPKVHDRGLHRDRIGVVAVVQRAGRRRPARAPRRASGRERRPVRPRPRGRSAGRARAYAAIAASAFVALWREVKLKRARDEPAADVDVELDLAAGRAKRRRG